MNSICSRKIQPFILVASVGKCLGSCAKCVAHIDRFRGDILRRRYIQKSIEAGIAGKQQEKGKENPLAQTQMVAFFAASKYILLQSLTFG